MTELSNTQNCSLLKMWRLTDTSGSSNGADADRSDPSEEELEEALERFNERLTRLHTALPANTALIVMTGHSDPRPMLTLSNRRQRFDKSYRESGGKVEEIAEEDRWSTEDDRDFETAVAEAREGMAFFCVK
jgi:RNA exonuclease 1